MKSNHKHELCNNHHICCIEMPKWFEKILKYNHGDKSLKAAFVIYLDLECLRLKMHSCQNHPEKSYIEKKARHKPSGWALFTKCSSDARKNKLNYYKGIDCIKKMWKKLKDETLKIFNHEEKEMIQLTDEENKSYEEQELCHIRKKKSFV